MTIDELLRHLDGMRRENWTRPSGPDWRGKDGER